MKRCCIWLLVLCLGLACASAGEPAALPEERFSRWMKESDLSEFATALNKGGFYPIRAEGRLHKGQREFRIAFERHLRNVRWWYCWYFNADAELYASVREKRLAQGYEEICHQTFTAENGEARHQVVWRKIESAGNWEGKN